MDAINQVFSLFRINYHNQYHAAFGDTVLLNQAKRLWKETLKHFTPEQILQGARRVIEDEEYLPNLHKMLHACEEALLQEGGLPGFRAAYEEAANANSPKAAQHWSHPAVYRAGRAVGWHDMTHLPENRTWPRFIKAYREMIQRVLAGETLTVDADLQLEEKPGRVLDKTEGHRKAASLRKLLSK